ncbi:hypothetical protein [Streptomyces mayteni]
MTGGRFRVAYAGVAESAHGALPEPLRSRFDAGMSVLAMSPYGGGSVPVNGERDRRDAEVAGVAVRYYVGPEVLTVAAVRSVFWPD